MHGNDLPAASVRHLARAPGGCTDVGALAQVSQVEFMMFMLEHLELVDREELDRILDVFNAADATGDGVLNLADVRARCNCSVRAPRGSHFSDALLPADARDRQEACSSATGTPSVVRGESEELESDV